MKLQGLYGEQKTKLVKDLSKGDTIIWNFGYKSDVVNLTPNSSGRTMTLTLKSREDGRERVRRMRMTTPVAIE